MRITVIPPEKKNTWGFFARHPIVSTMLSIQLRKCCKKAINSNNLKEIEAALTEALSFTDVEKIDRCLKAHCTKSKYIEMSFCLRMMTKRTSYDTLQTSLINLTTLPEDHEFERFNPMIVQLSMLGRSSDFDFNSGSNTNPLK